MTYSSILQELKKQMDKLAYNPILQELKNQSGKLEGACMQM
jgi:hypothetical protein